MFPRIRLAGFYAYQTLHPARGAITSGETVARPLTESVPTQFMRWYNSGSRMILGPVASHSSSDVSPTTKLVSFGWFVTVMDKSEMMQAAFGRPR